MRITLRSTVKGRSSFRPLPHRKIGRGSFARYRPPKGDTRASRLTPPWTSQWLASSCVTSSNKQNVSGNTRNRLKFGSPWSSVCRPTKSMRKVRCGNGWIRASATTTNTVTFHRSIRFSRALNYAVNPARNCLRRFNALLKNAARLGSRTRPDGP